MSLYLLCVCVCVCVCVCYVLLCLFFYISSRLCRSLMPCVYAFYMFVILCIVFMYIMCVCVAFVVLRVRMLCVPLGWCILCGLRPCALYIEPVKRKIERIHAPTGSTSGVPGSEAGNMMHPVYVCACVQKARMHAHGIRRRCTVRANASHVEKTHGYVCIDWIVSRR
jgi:hypothetical protein